MKKNISEFIKTLDASKTKVDEPLAFYTSLRIGGPADIIYFADNNEDLVKVVTDARKLEIPVTILGGGSNVLISDAGIRGLVVKNMNGEAEVLGKGTFDESQKEKYDERWESNTEHGTFRGVEFKDLNYLEDGKPLVEVKISSGAVVHKSMYKLIDMGITGLQWFSGIPGTVGGAIYNNIHGGSRFFGEVLKEVSVLDEKGNIKTLKRKDLGLEYDKSVFHEKDWIVLDAWLNLFEGDKDRALYTADEWLRRKKIQPRNSPGCVFKNISEEDKLRLSLESLSAGFIIEKVLKMTGFGVGEARISQVHHNFIVNEGKASAEDYLRVIKEIQKRAWDSLGLWLDPEIVFLGFDKE